MTMDARKQRVLQAIVALYGLEGEPVGSSVLANYFDMAVSSATLRNEMAALTKLGLLEQPHTSAGRVPSAKGYRYYLDNLLTDDQPLDRVTRARVDAVFASLDHEPEKLAQGAAKALAAISGCTAAVILVRGGIALSIGLGGHLAAVRVSVAGHATLGVGDGHHTVHGVIDEGGGIALGVSHGDQAIILCLLSKMRFVIADKLNFLQKDVSFSQMREYVSISIVSQICKSLLCGKK